MRTCGKMVVLLALAAIAACDRSEPLGAGKTEEVAAQGTAEPTPAGTAAPAAWDAAALHTAEQLAVRLRAAGVACAEYAPHEIRVYDAGYRKRLPLAAAIASCDTDGEEDLTFQVFAGAKQAQEYVTAKQSALCKRAAGMRLKAFPGFPYVDGGAWILEPDTKETAEKAAPILGGMAKVAGCEPE